MCSNGSLRAALLVRCVFWWTSSTLSARKKLDTCENLGFLAVSDATRGRWRRLRSGLCSRPVLVRRGQNPATACTTADRGSLTACERWRDSAGLAGPAPSVSTPWQVVARHHWFRRLNRDRGSQFGRRPEHSGLRHAHRTPACRPTFPVSRLWPTALGHFSTTPDDRDRVLGAAVTVEISDWST